MKKIPIILISLFFITLTANGQNLFFIGENSYPCTETFTLKSNSDEFYINDLKVLFARDGKKAHFVVNAKTEGDLVIQGKLIIYLDDGTVITLDDPEIYDYVNKVASAMYYLNNQELSKMKISNVNMVRYTLAQEDGSGHTFGGNFSASNKDIPTKDIIAKFFDNVDWVNEVPVKREQESSKAELDELMGGLNIAGDKGQPDGDPYTTSYYGSPGSGSGTGGYGLNGRSLVSKGMVQQECNQEGRIVVKIVVDRYGKVISATPGVKGTTNNDPCLLAPARKTAFMHKWNLDSNAPSQQVGFVVVNFKLGG